MEFYDHDHVYECVPAVLGIDKVNENPVTLGLKVVSVPEGDAEVEACRGLAAEAITKRTMDQLRSKFVFVKNLTVGGKKIETFDDFYAKAPRELVRWFLMAVYSTELLTAAERKN